METKLTGETMSPIWQVGVPAVTLRDQFAIAALGGLLASESPDNGQYQEPNQAAVAAYLYADAMMECRGRHNGK